MCASRDTSDLDSVFETYNVVSDGDLKDAARKLDASATAAPWSALISSRLPRDGDDKEYDGGTHSGEIANGFGRQPQNTVVGPDL